MTASNLPTVITWLFAKASLLMQAITNNWYTGALFGIFIIGAILGLLFTILGRRSGRRRAA